MGDLSALFGRLFGSRKRDGKPSWGRQTPIELLALTLAKNPEGWLVEPQRILRNGVEISWQGPFTSTTSIKVKMDGKKYPVLSSEVLALKEALQALLSKRPGTTAAKGDIVFFGGPASGSGNTIDNRLGRAQHTAPADADPRRPDQPQP